MTNDQQASYLDSLRQTKLARPTGSRPAPPSRFGGLKRSETQANVVAPIQPERPVLPTSNSMPVMPAPRLLHQRTESNVSAKGPFAGRALVRPPSAVPSDASSDIQMPERTKPDMPYMESGTRWMERQEVRSLRMALEDMDMEEEKKLHSAAQDEAAELVWKHKHPVDAEAAANAPYANPDVPRDYRQHLRKGSYQRSHSQDAMPMAAQRSASGGSRSTSGGSQSDTCNPSLTNKRKSMEVLRKVSPPSGIMSVGKNRRTPSGKSYGGLAEAVANDIEQANRRTSSGSKKRILSGEKKMFMNPNDRIWEDPQEDHSSPARPDTVVEPPIIAAIAIELPTYVRKNPFARVRMQADKLERSNSEPIMTIPSRPNSIDIQKNPPSQSKRPWYMSNEPLPPTPPSAGDRDADEVPQKVTPVKAISNDETPTKKTTAKETPTKEGMEIRSDDIRAATSKQRSDYSPKLPRPTVVSDKPGRPIVSFKQDWRPKEIVLEEKQSPLGRTSPKPDFTLSRSQTEPHPSSGPRRHMDAVPPPIPTIVVPDGPSIPGIVLPEEPEFAEPADFRSGPMTPMIAIDPPSISVEPPSINISGPEEPEARSARAPRPQHQPPGRPLPHHAATSPLPKSRPHYTPSIRQSGTLCAHCALPIAGRILSAAGERFHPGCFVCHQCHTNLELVAFYPEPENKRSDRLDRIATRQSGAGVALPEGTTDDEAYNLEYTDGDPSLRFYCHLDFHELFSPRCKSCKTPIEGEVIVACGAEWHAGHFFCAQCGDPFDSSTPFVEKDGYAWCVGCHTNRYSSKCRKCKKPVVDTVVKALGYDWHGGCFVCVVCSSPQAYGWEIYADNLQECNGEFQDGRYFLRGDSQDPVCVKCEQRRLKA